MTSIPSIYFSILAGALFSIGVSGIFLNRKNIISLLMSLELILLSVNINLVASSSILQDLNGQIFAIFVLTVAGAESAIGLAILVVYFHNRKNIEIDNISSMRG
jgi:NADH-quinone oxidoreductase subunit K